MARKFRWPWEADDGESEVLDFSIFDSLFDTSDESPAYLNDVADLYGGSGDLFTPSRTHDLADLPSADYSNEGKNYPTSESTKDSPINITTDIGTGARELAKLDTKSNIPKFFQDKEGNFDWLKLLTLLGAGYAGYKSKAPPSGGGVAYAYKGPSTRLVRTIDQGPYGPTARHTRVPINAAQGGIMQAYAQGGPVAMEDGGFVMTKKAVDGAGGPQGIQSLLPGARPIRGPGTGTSDSIPAYIQGRNGATPARVSNGEAYVPKRTVQQAGGSRQLYNLMNMLQRRA